MTVTPMLAAHVTPIAAPLVRVPPAVTIQSAQNSRLAMMDLRMPAVRATRIVLLWARAQRAATGITAPSLSFAMMVSEMLVALVMPHAAQPARVQPAVMVLRAKNLKPAMMDS